IIALIVLLALGLSACGPAAPPPAGDTPTPTPGLPPPAGGQAEIVPTTVPAGSATTPAAPDDVVTVAAETELDAIRNYLVDKLVPLRQATTALRATGDQYYTQAGRAPNYAQLWQTDRAAWIALVQEGQTRWRAANEIYEQIEGIVGGEPGLARYNWIIDA